MDEATPGLDAVIAGIWKKHRDLMFARMSSIESALSAAAAGSLDSEVRETALRDAHKMAGALGTFGLHEGTMHARRIENALASDEDIDVADLRTSAAGLRAALESR